LQKRASMYLRINSEKAMHIAESLYQRGILSYPRTETDFFKEGFELLPIIEDFKNHSMFGAYSTALMERDGFQWPANGGHDDQAHPPIHPLKSVDLASLENDDERKIYEMVTRHFLACCSKNAKGHATDMTVEVPAGGESFKASGLVIIERNWLDIYPWEKWYASKVPALNMGDTFSPTTFEMTEGKTAPPSPLSESDLISQMDTHGIGTDATIASHIALILSREYVYKDHRGYFFPSDLGKALVEGYNSMGYQLAKPYLRASMELDCQRVAKGELNKKDMLTACLTKMKECFQSCTREVHKLESALDKYFSALGTGDAADYICVQQSFATCGLCNAKMDYKVSKSSTNDNARGAGGGGGGGDDRQRRQMRFLFCSPCRKSYILPSFGELTLNNKICPICSFQVLNAENTATGKKYTFCPKCYKDPPVWADGDSSNGFKCFNCSHPDCELAIKSSPILPCQLLHCTGSLVLHNKANTDGSTKYWISCSKYAQCGFKPWWLPSFVRTAKVRPDLSCAACSRKYSSASTQSKVLKLLVNINLRLAPNVRSPNPEVCVICDSIWEENHHSGMRLQVNESGQNSAAAAFTRHDHANQRVYSSSSSTNGHAGNWANTNSHSTAITADYGAATVAGLDNHNIMQKLKGPGLRPTMRNQYGNKRGGYRGGRGR
jgi:DNA topoisomerase-3